MRRVSVLIPTFRNGDGFLRAARAALRQIAPCEIEIVGLDNSPERSALHAFSMLRCVRAANLVFGAEPRTGRAFARNAALAHATGDLIAWLNDDQEPEQFWLSALLRALERDNASIALGPIHARVAGAEHGFVARAFSRLGPDSASLTLDNSLMRRSALVRDRAFAAGKSDADALVHDVRLAWAPEARVTEYVPPARAKLSAAAQRAFVNFRSPMRSRFPIR